VSISDKPEWAAEAAQRYLSGETKAALCDAYHASNRKMIKVLTGEGVTLRSAREVKRLSDSIQRQQGDR
jgi:hypothetical protein